MAQFFDRTVTAAVRQEDVVAELTKAITDLKLAIDRDQDPADAVSQTVVEDPANNWVGRVVVTV